MCLYGLFLWLALFRDILETQPIQFLKSQSWRFDETTIVTSVAFFTLIKIVSPHTYLLNLLSCQLN
ncbi:hypothetical protein VIBNIMADA3020_800054 [Vibrio nigripulchritudo MADA3020]|nr:hypothetical protein VIBNIMADA3020_800054 [Vibrio nigripulchritudo MADA3020]CCN55292.1 hypothetical protein VIBNIMADA3021_740011 [Vibrio nigripulchritudo MADA3021]